MKTDLIKSIRDKAVADIGLGRAVDINDQRIRLCDALLEAHGRIKELEKIIRELMARGKSLSFDTKDRWTDTCFLAVKALANKETP